MTVDYSTPAVGLFVLALLTLSFSYRTVGYVSCWASYWSQRTIVQDSIAIGSLASTTETGHGSGRQIPGFFVVFHLLHFLFLQSTVKFSIED